MINTIDISSSLKISELQPVTVLSCSDTFVFSHIDSDDQGTLEFAQSLYKSEKRRNGFLRYLADKVAKNALTEDDAKSILSKIRQTSKNIMYSQLSNQIGQDVSSLLHLSSMAFRDKREYSEVGHQHEYSKVRVQAVYPEQSDPSFVKIMTLSVFNSTGLIDKVDAYAPEFEPPIYELYKIGEIRAFGVNNLTHVSYDSADFDGWVFPDGETQYPKTVFPDAYQLFKDAPNSTLTSFVVPSIDGFIAGVGDYSKYLEHEEWENTLDSHTHSGLDSKKMTQIASRDIKVNVKFPYFNAGPSSGGKTAMHTGYSGKTKGKIRYSIKIENVNIKTQPARTDEMPAQETESYPRYKNIPVMVYIGRPS